MNSYCRYDINAAYSNYLKFVLSLNKLKLNDYYLSFLIFLTFVTVSGNPKVMTATGVPVRPAFVNYFFTILSDVDNWLDIVPLLVPTCILCRYL